MVKKLSFTIFAFFTVMFVDALFWHNFQPTDTSASWYSDAYAYRQSVSFTHNTDISSPRRVTITINTSTLVSAGKLQSDCDDVRFTDRNTGKKLRYQLVSGCNTSSTIFYAEFLSIFNGNNSAYIYYGNPAATSESTDLSGVTSINSSTSTGYLTPGAASGQWAGDYTTLTSSNNVYLIETSSGQTATISNFNINIPAGASIDGITVRMEAGSGDDTNGDSIAVSLSHNAGSNYVNNKSTSTLTTTDTTYTLGSNTDTWGRTWSDTEFSNANFRLRLTAGIDAASFPTGSKVLLSDRTYIPIEQLSVGAEILSYNTETGTLVPNNITEIQQSPKNGYYLINNQVKATNDELIYAKTSNSSEFKWLRVDHLSIDDTILYTDTQAIQETEVHALQFIPEQVEVYTIKATDPFNNYWVDGYLFDPPVGNAVGVDLLEVNVYYSEGPTVTVSSEETSASPILQYSLDEGYGTTLNSTGSNNYVGTISGALWRTEDLCISGKCLYFDGSNDAFTTSGTTSNVRTVSFWVRPITTTEQLVDLNGSAYIESSSGTLSATGFTSPTIYINGQVSSTLVANRWQHVIVTTSTGLSASALRLGQISTNYGQMFIDEFQLYTTALTESQVKSLYNSRSGNLTSIQQGAYDQKALSDGLVGYWKMDESATPSIDSAGNNQSGTWQGNTTTASGKYGSSMYFDGVNDYVRVTHTAALDPESELTYTAWINPSVVNATRMIMAKNDENVANYYTKQFYIQDGYLGFGAYSGVSNYYTSTTLPITAGQWHHVAVSVKENEHVRLYINGTQIYENTNIGNILLADNEDFTIGAVLNTNIPVYDYQGSIDETRIYNRALSSQEIQQLYNWAPGPIGYWKLDENNGTNVYDTSSNGLNGTVSGGALWNPGKMGASLRFDGTDDYVSISDNSLFDLSNSFTIQAWTKYTGGTFNAEDTLLGRGKGNSNDSHYYFYKVNGTDIFEFYVENSSGTGVSLQSNTISANRWYHLAGTWDGTTTRFFVDGIQVDSDTLTGNFSNTSNPLIIGSGESFTNPAGFPYEGFVDEVKIYNYARTPSQIIQDMNAGHPLVGTPIAAPVGHWKFDEGYGTTANDQTPNANHLTLNTASWTSDGKFGKAWNGTGSTWLTRADDPDFDFSGSDEFTISQWIKSDSSTNPSVAEMTLAKFETTGGSTRGYAIVANTNGTLSFVLDDDNDGSFEAFTTTQDYYDGNWHQIIVVKSGTSYVNIYIDGELIVNDNSITDTGSLANNGSLVIGDNNGVDSLYEFNGDIDELKIYRAALSTSDVQSEYNQGKTMVLGALSTASDGITPSNSYAREHCIPGDTSTCAPRYYTIPSTKKPAQPFAISLGTTMTAPLLERSSLLEKSAHLSDTPPPTPIE